VARKFLALEVALLGWVAIDEHVRKAVRLKRPFLLEFPRATAAEHVRGLAEKLLAEEPVARPTGTVKQFAKAIHMEC
jgi:MinD-like ATPase involved in chromosome partitioning or flagellar assembly